MRVPSLLARAGELAAAPDDVSGVRFVGYFAEGAAAADVRTARARRPWPDARRRARRWSPSSAPSSGKPSVVIAVNDTARERGLNAGELVRGRGAALGGSGGGKDDVAQGGGTDAAGGARRRSPTSGGPSPSG